MLQSPARPKQGSFLHKASPARAAEGHGERPKSPVSTLNQTPSATPSPAPTSAAELHSGHATPTKAAASTCSESGTDASVPHQAAKEAADSSGKEEDAAAAGAEAQETSSADAGSQDEGASAGMGTQAAAADEAAADTPQDADTPTEAMAGELACRFAAASSRHAAALHLPYQTKSRCCVCEPSARQQGCFL